MILDVIVEDKKKRLVEQKSQVGEAEMIRLADGAEKKGGSFYEALNKPEISIIGEFKKASPSLGKIDSKISIEERISAYTQAADAISCLTEQDHFHGCTEDLKQIRTMTPLPILRKDFMIDTYQFYEAKAIGADAVLLIAAILDDVQLRDFYQLARELGLDVLLEVHNEEELERALKTDARIIGINNRNLKDFTIQLDTTVRLSKEIPQEKTIVAESGIITDTDVRLLKKCGVDAFLIGRAFMETEKPKELAEKWKKMQ